MQFHGKEWGPTFRAFGRYRYRLLTVATDRVRIAFMAKIRQADNDSGFSDYGTSFPEE